MGEKQTDEIPMNRTYVSFDWALKHILRDKANFCVLEGFLSELLHEDITILELIESESNQEYWRDKFNRVDLMVKTGKDERIIIEIQNDHQIDYFQRMSFGTAKVLIENIKSGARYSEVKRIISVNIAYFDLGKGEDYIYYGRTVFDGIHRHDRLQLSDRQRAAYSCQEVGQLFPEYYLIKVGSFADITTDNLDEWVYFLRNSDILPEFKAKGLHEARQRLALLQMNQQERAAYDAYVEDLRFQNSASWSHLEQGRDEGRKQMAAEVAQAQAEAKAEAEKCQQAQAEAKAEAEKRQQAQAEAKAVMEKALALLIAAGVPAEQARKNLGL